MKNSLGILGTLHIKHKGKSIRSLKELNLINYVRRTKVASYERLNLTLFDQMGLECYKLYGKWLLREILKLQVSYG